MACQILVCHDRYPGRSPLSLFDRIPLKCPIDGGNSQVHSVMLAPSPHGNDHCLESGTFDFVQVVGITENETIYAKSHGGPQLVDLLKAANAFPVTDPARDSVC